MGGDSRERIDADAKDPGGWCSGRGGRSLPAARGCARDEACIGRAVPAASFGAHGAPYDFFVARRGRRRFIAALRRLVSQ